ncbi:MAG: hypothetical protein Q9227_002434 [Pyrenula ochraceoflavens]
MATSLTARGEAAKDPFHQYTASWKNLGRKFLFVYASGEISGTRSDFDKNESNGPTSFAERMLPTSFANHTLRALFGGFDEVTEDNSMHEKYMLGYFVTYRHLLRDYTKRTLTKPGDALRAWSGIAALLERFADDKKVVCGLPTAAMDLALLWTPVGDPLGSKKRRDQRAEQGKDSYPTWSWASMTEPVDLLVSQRWCAEGEGLAGMINEMKQDPRLNPEDEPEAKWQSRVRYIVKQLSKLNLGFDLSDERPFHSEVTWLGLQNGNEIIPISPDPDICPPPTLSPNPQDIPSIQMLHPAPPTETLHLEASLVPLKTLWKEGGHIITTKAQSWYADIEQVMKQSAKFSLIRSLYSFLIESFTNASWQEWRQIVPDRDQKELLNNMGFVYDVLTPERLMNHPQNPDLVQDFSKIWVLALSRVRAFPPTTFYWQYLNKRFGGMLTPRKFREWDVVGEPWATMNVMLVHWDHTTTSSGGDAERGGGGGLARRICVGHVSAERFRKAGPERRYIRLC